MNCNLLILKQAHLSPLPHIAIYTVVQLYLHHVNVINISTQIINISSLSSSEPIRQNKQAWLYFLLNHKTS